MRQLPLVTPPDTVLEIHHCDIHEYEHEGEQAHVVFCDAPYEMKFMGHAWDASGVAFSAKAWAAMYDALLPGGFLLTFASPRGLHLQAKAIEDAGFMIHPFLFGWAYGTGLPKATRVGIPAEKAGGVIQHKKRTKVYADGHVQYHAGGKQGYHAWAGKGEYKEPVPEGQLGVTWTGHRYGLQALKPSLEPMIFAQRPYGKVSSKTIHEVTGWDHWHTPRQVRNTPAFRLKMKQKGVTIPPAYVEYNVVTVKRQALRKGLKNDTLVLLVDPTNTDAPRLIATVDESDFKEWTTERPLANILTTGAGTVNIEGCRIRNRRGRSRWPANLMVLHHPACTEEACHPDCPGRALAEMSGITTSSGGLTVGVGSGDGRVYSFGTELSHNAGGLKDTGSALRFFLDVFPDPVYYTPKAPRWERDAGCGRNKHPTIKPLRLALWCASLLKPPDAYAPLRAIVPFGGVFTEAIALMLAGFHHITVCELEADYISVGKRRWAFWRNVLNEAGTNDVETLMETAKCITRR
jgi:DNA modification methylase